MILARVLCILLRGTAVVAAILLVLAGLGYAVGSFWIVRAEPPPRRSRFQDACSTSRRIPSTS